MDFVAIDFETANCKRTSACSIGIVTVQDNKVVEEISYLIKPYPYRFDPINTSIHGISYDDVENCPTFDMLWDKIKPKLLNQIVVAHNASFDISVLNSMLEFYGLEKISFHILCTYRISQSLFPDLPCFRLDFISEFMGIDLFSHHDACSDAKACAQILLNVIEKTNICCNDDIEPDAKVSIGFYSDSEYYPCRIKGSGPYASAKTLRAKDYSNMSIICRDEDFLNKHFVFTGALKTMTRQKAMEIVAKSGGVPQDSVIKTTDYLVCGIQDLHFVKDGKSAKFKKAISYRQKGFGIEIIGEDQFLSMIDSNIFEVCMKACTA